MRLSLGLILSIAFVLCGCGDNNDTPGGTGGDAGTGGAAGAGGMGGAAGGGGMGRAAVGDLQVVASASSTMADVIEYQIMCGDLLFVAGALELEDAPSGPGQVAESTFLDLPVGRCDVTLTVRDDEGAAACTGSFQADVVAEETAMVSIPVNCDGDVHVLVSVSSTLANRIEYQIVCGDLLDVSGTLALEDAPSGPGQVAEHTFLDLPVGTCDVTLTVRDDEGAAACTGSFQADVVTEETSMVSILLNCPEPPE